VRTDQALGIKMLRHVRQRPARQPRLRRPTDRCGLLLHDLVDLAALVVGRVPIAERQRPHRSALSGQLVELLVDLDLDPLLFTADLYDRDPAALAVPLGLNGLRVSEACATNIEDLGLERGHRSIGNRTGLGRVHPHMLRAAFIMAALDAGVPLRDVQIAARHADPRTTTIYDRQRQNLDRHATYVVVAFVTLATDLERHFEDVALACPRIRDGPATRDRRENRRLARIRRRVEPEENPYRRCATTRIQKR
jgi:integrase